MEELTTKEKKEVQGLFRQAQRKSKVPESKDNLLEWSMAELNAYIKHHTKGISTKKKLKFGQNLIKEIEDRKKQNQ